MASVFTKIIQGELPAYKVAENNFFCAFLDREPLRRGHVLVVPKSEIDKMYHLENAHLSELMVFAKPLALAMEKAFVCKRIGFAIIGLEVPHAHLHLVPIDTADDLNFTRPKLNLSTQELEEDKQAILQHLSAWS